MKYIKNSVEQNRNSIIFESHPQNAKKELIKMFNPENEVYNPETKRYELIDVELPDDYFIKDIKDLMVSQFFNAIGRNGSPCKARYLKKASHDPIKAGKRLVRIIYG